jgi:DMSO/TMAO reductase YedYZ heme-binding membrane subunit
VPYFKSLLTNIRFYILIISILFSIGSYLWVLHYIPGETLQIIRITQIYAFTALILLYIALLIGPLCYQLRWIPKRALIVKSRRAIGVSAWYFGLLHAMVAFFEQLGGFPGLFFLPGNYLLAISLSFTALVILTLMASTSFNWAIGKWWWKPLHRFVYLASIFILIHALMLGSHFQDLSSNIPQIAFFLLAFLLFLQSRRIDAYLERKFPNISKFSFVTLLWGITLGVGLLFYYYPRTERDGSLSLGIHQQHIEIAKEAQNQMPSGVPNFPGLVGDRTKRFTVTFDHPTTIIPDKDTELTFKINDASNGNPVLLFNKPYEKTMHLIIVDESLSYYDHIHPEQEGSSFVVTTKFPKTGIYHLYTDFQPIGAIEQQFAFTLTVGSPKHEEISLKEDLEFTKQIEDYQITLSYEKPLVSSKLSIGQQELKFTIKDKDGSNVITLEPYLASFGHLVMINTKTFDYLHVHPTNLTAPKPEERSGPDITFLPLGLYGPIKPGLYKVFGQFKPDAKLILVDFVVKVE